MELDVIVVGGGLAGLGAAKTLCSDGNFTVAVLEADTVVGGRVRTDCLPDGSLIPLGAASFHGREGNSLLNFAKAENLANSVEVEIQDDSVLHTYTGGRTIPDEVVERVEERVWEIMDEITVCFNKGDWSSFERVEKENVACNGVAAPSLDLHDFICSKMDPVFNDCSIFAYHDPITILEGILAYEGITEGCKGLHGIDLASFGVWSYLDDDIDIIFKDNPYHKIIDSLVSKIPPGVIQLEKEVCSIAWQSESRNDKVVVKCVDGSTYKAKHVIYTCSLGVLKHACLSGTFVPSLPTKKLTAINDVGMSLVNKVFLQFDAPLFPGNKYNQFRLYWSEKDKTDTVVASNPWILGFQYIRILPNVADSFIYHTFFIGKDALAVEELPEHETSLIILHALNLFLSHSIPKLLAVKVTHWNKPYTRGSYSYTPQGTTLDKREELVSPVSDGKHHPLRILFSGEATSINQFGCAHSAFDTGIREAKRLIEYHSTGSTSCT